MAKPRKKWATKLNTPGAPMKNFPSETKAFANVRELAKFVQGGTEIGGTTVKVFVDEGLGRGWELFEVVDLADAAW